MREWGIGPPLQRDREREREREQQQATLEAAKIAANRDQWVKSWTSLVLK